MVTRGYTSVRITNKLREAKIHPSQGASIADASMKISVTVQTYYRWYKEYGGIKVK